MVSYFLKLFFAFLFCLLPGWNGERVLWWLTLKVCHALSITRFLYFARVKMLLAFLRLVSAFAHGVADRHVKVSGLSSLALGLLFAVETGR